MTNTRRHGAPLAHIGLLALCIAAAPIAGRAQACVSPGPLANGYLRGLQIIVTKTDSVFVQSRQRVGLPTATAAEVTHVMDDGTCVRLERVFRASLGGDGAGLTGTVIVLRIRDIFWVRDPGAYCGEFGIAMLMDTTGRVISRYTGG